MVQYLFDKCDCNLNCIEGILANNGYDFQKIEKNTLWYYSKNWSMSITGNYSPEFNLKIDASIKGNSSGVADIGNEVSYLTRILKDACKPNKIVNSDMRKLNYDTLK